MRYQDRIRLVLVDDQDERFWLGDHRVVEDFAHPDELALDERLLTACWAWEQIELPLAGRRRPLHRAAARRRAAPDRGRRYTTTEKRNAAARLGARGAGDARPVGLVGPDPVLDALRAGAPSARPACGGTGATTPSVLLAEGYRERPPDLLEEGRLGGTSWGMGRGAAPPHLGRRDDGADAAGGQVLNAAIAAWPTLMPPSFGGTRVVDEDGRARPRASTRRRPP